MTLAVEWYAGRHTIMEPRRAMALLLQQTSSETGVAREQILGDQRHKPVVAARHRFMATAFTQGYSMSEIGRFLSRDHTTVMYALRKLGVIADLRSQGKI